MSESLVIQLREGASPCWLVCNDDGQIVVDALSGELTQAATMSAGRRVAVIVPASDVLVTESDAPAKNTARLAQVIPYALEERVADEIENLHFAIGERDANTGRVAVSVVQRARIDAWLAELRAAGLEPQAIYPESALLPSMPGQLIALLDGDSITLRAPDTAAIVMPTLSLSEAFEMALATQTSPVAGLEPAPLGLLLYASQDDWTAHELVVDALRDRFTGVKVQLLPHGPLTVLAPAAANGEAVNLLQGALAVASPHEQGWRSWRIAAALGIALLFVHIGARWFELSRLQKSEDQLDDSIVQAFHTAMPGQTNPVNARQRVQKRLDEIRAGGGGGALLPALAAIATAKNAAPTATIQALTFRNGTISLSITAPDAASLDAIGQELRSSQWQANLKGGSVVGDSYRGEIEIRKAGA